MSPDGHTLGVLAVFDKEPRSNVSSIQRRMLSGFTTIAMTDLDLAVRTHEDGVEYHGGDQSPAIGDNASPRNPHRYRSETELERALNEITAALARTADARSLNINVYRRPASTEDGEMPTAVTPHVPGKIPGRVGRLRTNTMVPISEQDRNHEKLKLRIDTKTERKASATTATGGGLPTPWPASGTSR